MKTKFVKSDRGKLKCPYCKAIINCSVFSKDTCDHLIWKTSEGEGKFENKEDKLLKDKE